MSMGTPTVHRVMRSRWLLPAVLVLIGLVYLGAEWAGGRRQLGFEMLGVMVVAAVALLIARRNETVRGLTTADGRDERFASMDLQATAISGTITICAVLVGFVVDVARGGDGGPYLLLGVIAGLSYIAAVVVLRFRG